MDSKHPRNESSEKGAPSQLKSLTAYLKGATSAQIAQVEMIRRVFNSMDADGDGLLSAADIKAYFLSIGRPSTDQIVRKWIRERDVDQDGVISLEEYVSSFSYQLDPSSHHPWLKDSTPSISSVATAFGSMKLACSSIELTVAVTAAVGYVQRILDSPSTKEFWKISLNESEFHQKIGHIFGGVKLMLALGFDLEANGQILALKNNGPPWEIVPSEIRKNLTRGVEELQFHKNSLAEPTISNIAAGRVYEYLSLDSNNVVSTAISQFGETSEKAEEWIVALETILKILTNITQHPTDHKYFAINPANPNFHSRSTAHL